MAQALETVSLTELADRSPAHLSGGQRRRAALATVLACEPEILVLDEPSANLDPVARRELAETLSGLDATMLIVTHDLPYAAQLCDRAVVMDGGVIVADGRDRGDLVGCGTACRAPPRAAMGLHRADSRAQRARSLECIRREEVSGGADGGHGGSPHNASSAFSITSGSAGWIQYWPRAMS